MIWHHGHMLDLDRGGSGELVLLFILIVALAAIVARAKDRAP